MTIGYLILSNVNLFVPIEEIQKAFQLNERPLILGDCYS